MEANSYTMQLNRTHLLFIPSRSTPSGTVVQVRLRGEQEEGNLSEAFLVQQAFITGIIETLLVGHVNALRQLPERVIVEEAITGYTLIGVRKPWKYGRGKLFFHGDAKLQPAEHKWIFHFETCRVHE